MSAPAPGQRWARVSDWPVLRSASMGLRRGTREARGARSRGGGGGDAGAPPWCGCCLRPSTEGGGRGPQQDWIGLSQRACRAGSWCGGGRGGRRLSGCRGRTGLGGLPSSGVSAAPAAGLAGLAAAAGCLPAFLPVEGRPMLLQCSWRGRRTGGLFRGVDRRSPGATGCLAPVSVLTQAFARPRLQRGKTKTKALTAAAY